MPNSAGIPPGVHLQAMFSYEGSPARQLRILGDEERGYLLAGLSGLPDDDDFWFPTLEMAFARAERVGVGRDAWTQITSVGGAQML